MRYNLRTLGLVLYLKNKNVKYMFSVVLLYWGTLYEKILGIPISLVNPKANPQFLFPPLTIAMANLTLYQLEIPIYSLGRPPL